jgi:hypothetical protein
MTPEQERTEAKKALETATQDWQDNGNEIVSKQNLRMGIGGFLKDEDNHLAANAPAWLRNSLDREEQLIADNERLQKIADDYDALVAIMDRARKLAFLTVKEEEDHPHFKMDVNGNLTRIEDQ